MSECQLLHPDPADSISEDEEEEEESDEQGNVEGLQPAEVAQLESNLVDYTNGSNGQSKNLPAGDEEPMDE